MNKTIDQMDLTEIKKEVQKMRDDLEKTKRSYGDILYNLDAENFSDNYATIKAQYSVDGTSWHDTYSSSDTYMRISYNCGTKWSEAIQIS